MNRVVEFIDEGITYSYDGMALFTTDESYFYFCNLLAATIEKMATGEILCGETNNMHYGWDNGAEFAKKFSVREITEEEATTIKKIVYSIEEKEYDTWSWFIRGFFPYCEMERFLGE